MQLETRVAEEFIINNSYLNLCVEMIQHSPDISNAICGSSRNNTNANGKGNRSNQLTDLQHPVAYTEIRPAPGRSHQQHTLG